jgi:transposase
MDRYIGLDVHATSTTASVVSSRGKKLGSTVLETNGEVLVEYLKGQSGKLHVCLEEGEKAGWLHSILKPHASDVVVVRVKKSEGQKNDKLDAFGLAEMMRRGAIDVAVFKEEGGFGALRNLMKVHLAAVEDAVRSQNRIKSLYRSCGVQVFGKKLYTLEGRDDWLDKLSTKSRMAAKHLYSHYDAMCEIREQAETELVAESHKHSISRILETCPGLGKVRVARLMAVVVTPHRFRKRSQFWAYCGLAIVMRSTSDWMQVPDGSWVKVKKQQTRGLNRNHNRILKDVFKGAATTVIRLNHQSPFAQGYRLQLANGTKPNLARLTLARRIAATSLAMWKREEVYTPNERTMITT